MEEVAYKLMQSTSCITLDETLVEMGLTHLEYRNWLMLNGHAVPSPSPGLAVEVTMSDWSDGVLCRRYHMTQHELNHCFNDMYVDHSAQAIMAEAARRNGQTELSIKKEFGDLFVRKPLMHDEIREALKQGIKPKALALDYGVSEARISQLRDDRRHRPTLTKQQKAEIAASNKDPLTLAKEYGVTRNTIYVIKRGG